MARLSKPVRPYMKKRGIDEMQLAKQAQLCIYYQYIVLR